MLCSEPIRAEDHNRAAVRRPAPFIVGVARSGKTLLRLMLDAHPLLAIPPETNFIPRMVRACGSAATPSACFVQTLRSLHRWDDFHLNADELQRRVELTQPFELGEALRAFYSLYAARFGKPRWGDKTPAYAEHMLAIERLLPEARFIHVLRDGRDVALSLRDVWFGPASIEEAATQWCERIQAARRQATGVGAYLEIRYEDLVRDTESVLRRVCEFIELPWSEGMLEYHTTASERLAELVADVEVRSGLRTVRAEERRAKHAWTSRPPDASRIGLWRTEMNTEARQRFQHVAGDLLVELGYA